MLSPTRQDPAAVENPSTADVPAKVLPQTGGESTAARPRSVSYIAHLLSPPPSTSLSGGEVQVPTSVSMPGSSSPTPPGPGSDLEDFLPAGGTAFLTLAPGAAPHAPTGSGINPADEASAVFALDPSKREAILKSNFAASAVPEIRAAAASSFTIRQGASTNSSSAQSVTSSRAHSPAPAGESRVDQTPPPRVATGQRHPLAGVATALGVDEEEDILEADDEFHPSESPHALHSNLEDESAVLSPLTPVAPEAAMVPGGPGDLNDPQMQFHSYAIRMGLYMLVPQYAGPGEAATSPGKRAAIPAAGTDRTGLPTGGTATATATAAATPCPTHRDLGLARCPGGVRCPQDYTSTRPLMSPVPATPSPLLTSAASATGQGPGSFLSGNRHLMAGGTAGNSPAAGTTPYQIGMEGLGSPAGFAAAHVPDRLGFQLLRKAEEVLVQRRRVERYEQRLAQARLQMDALSAELAEIRSELIAQHNLAKSSTVHQHLTPPEGHNKSDARSALTWADFAVSTAHQSHSPADLRDLTRMIRTSGIPVALRRLVWLTCLDQLVPGDPGTFLPGGSFRDGGLRLYMRYCRLTEQAAAHIYEPAQTSEWDDMIRGISRQGGGSGGRSSSGLRSRLQKSTLKAVGAGSPGDVGPMDAMPAGSYSLLAGEPDALKNDFCNVRLDPVVVAAIEQDLHRTLPEYASFSLMYAPGIVSLRRILRAYSLRNPAVGYIQCFSVISATLLLQLSEHETFWMLCHIIENIFPPNYFTKNQVGIFVDQLVLGDLIKIHLPELAQALEQTQTDISVIFSGPFASLFVNSLPMECVLRIWDLLFVDGSVALFAAALAILRNMQKDLLHAMNRMASGPLSAFSLPNGLCFEIQQLMRNAVYSSTETRRIIKYLGRMILDVNPETVSSLRAKYQHHDPAHS